MATIRSAAKYLAKNGPVKTVRKIRKRTEKEAPKYPEMPIKVLLLTNRDSDNVGDQVIEACAISLISTVLKNLGITNFKINSRAAGMVTKKYLATRDDSLLDSARKSISEADLIVFGGAPLFNYKYQVFYERTAITLELAHEYNVPVIFSSLGLEAYSEDNERCQRLKQALNLGCVKQITTRDDFESLQQFTEGSDIAIAKVSDPAVFTWKVFEKFLKPNTKKKVGVFVIRANAFTDNKINFTREEAIALWIDLIKQLEMNGIDYELITSGHFGDEALLDDLIKNYNVDAKKCVFNINDPETLIERISTYDAVVSCRLHPSIISFSLGVPSVGIVWNSKVNYFYDAINYTDRIIETDGISGEFLLNKIKEIIAEGVQQDEQYLMSVYVTLFDAIRAAIKPEDRTTQAYTYAQLLENIVPFNGTPAKEKSEKIKRKFRRTYGTYNDIKAKNQLQRKRIKELEKKVADLEAIQSAQE